MSYIPNTQQEQMQMLKACGLSEIDDLFSQIPTTLKLKQPLNLPGPLAEASLIKHMNILASKNINLDTATSFLGAGAYDHLVPSVIKHLVSRGEFLTAYTPYQAEISQGVLQSIFEFQTLIAELTGMEAANASMYDGATALAEAALLACNATRRRKVGLPANLHPEWIEVARTYLENQDIEPVIIPYQSDSGQIDIATMDASLAKELSCLVVQQPNFFGCIEDVTGICSWIKNGDGLLVAAVNPISLGILKRPGDYGADIVVGDGGSLGNPLSYGGPTVGFFATSGTSLIRRMPGRIVGETIDGESKRGYVLTMQTREQHIRREKATSNICTNQALNALVATMYLSLLGKQGLRAVANQCLQKTAYLQQALLRAGYQRRFTGPCFNEFTISGDVDWAKVNHQMLDKGFLAGLPLQQFDKDLSDSLLLAVTEARTKEEIDEFSGLLGGYCSGS